MKTLTLLASIFAASSAVHVTQQSYNDILKTQPQTFKTSPSQAYSRPHVVQQYTQPQAYAQQSYQGQGQAYAQHAAFQGHSQGHGQGQIQDADKSARIINYELEHNGHNYMYTYETENGIKAQESGSTQGKTTQVQGGYSYTGDDGQVYTVTYTADENGFRPQGAHLPTPPPIPEAIAKAIEQNAQDEANGIFDDGKYTEEQHKQTENYQQQQYHQLDQNQQYQFQETAYQVSPAPQYQQYQPAVTVQPSYQVSPSVAHYQSESYQPAAVTVQPSYQVSPATVTHQPAYLPAAADHQQYQVSPAPIHEYQH